MKTLLNVLVLGALATAGAWGGIVVTLDDPSQTGHPGQTLQFFGVISNNGDDTVFMNGDDLTLAGLSFTTNDLFFTTVPLSLDGGSSSDHIELFDVTVSDPLLDSPAKYLGSYTLLGGADAPTDTDPGSQDNLASANFDVTTGSGATGTPEPSTGSLLGVALVSRFIVKFLGCRANPSNG
jgi:hypothetical protein